MKGFKGYLLNNLKKAELKKAPDVGTEYENVNWPYHPSEEGKYIKTVTHKPTGQKIHTVHMIDGSEHEGSHTGSIYYITDNGHPAGKPIARTEIGHTNHETGEDFDPHFKAALTEPEHRGKGLNTLLHMAALKDYGTLKSDYRLSPGSQKTYEKLAQHPGIKAKLMPTDKPFRDKNNLISYPADTQHTLSIKKPKKLAASEKGVQSPSKNIPLARLKQIKQDNNVGANGKDYSEEELDQAIIERKISQGNKMVSQAKRHEKQMAEAAQNTAAPVFPPPMKKGVNRRLFPVNQEQKDHRATFGQRLNEHLFNWQKLVEPKAKEALDSPIGRLPENTNKRAMMRLMGKTKSRKNPETGEFEFLMHRGISQKELNTAIDLPSRSTAHGNHTAWTPNLETAKHFHQLRGRPEGKGGLVSAWIPQSAISTVPKHWGTYSDFNREYEHQPKKGKGRNEYSGEHEVLVRPGNYSLVHDKDVKKLTGEGKREGKGVYTLDQAINFRANPNFDSKERQDVTETYANERGRLKRAELKKVEPRSQNESHPNQPWIARHNTHGQLQWHANPEQAYNIDQHLKRPESIQKLLSMVPDTHKSALHSLIKQTLTDPNRHFIPTAEKGREKLRARHLRSLLMDHPDIKLDSSEPNKLKVIRNSHSSVRQYAPLALVYRFGESNVGKIEKNERSGIDRYLQKLHAGERIKSGLYKSRNGLRMAKSWASSSQRSAAGNRAYEELMQKGLKANLLTTAGLLAGIVSPSVSDAPRSHAKINTEAPIQQEQQAPKVDKKRMLAAIEQVESRGGQDTNHAMVNTGLNAGHKAVGRYGLMPITIKDMVAKTPSLKDHAHVANMDHDQIHEYMSANPELEDKVASAYYDKLYRNFGDDHAAIGHSWLNGVRGTYKAIKANKDINNHWHVKKIKAAYQGQK